jgi:transcriptional regulator with XRE-family HTH domain
MDANQTNTQNDKRVVLSSRLTAAVARDGRPARQVALAAGVDPVMMHYYMTGKRYPKIHTIRAIALALGCSATDLTGEPDVVRVEIIERRRDIGKDEEALLKAWKDRDVGALLGFAQRAQSAAA